MHMRRDGFGEEPFSAGQDAREAQLALDDARREARLDAARVWEVSSYFGGCPTCLCIEEQLNVERLNFMVCHTHKTAWCVGSNLLGSWRDETPDIWERNAALLAIYAEIDPLYNPIFNPIFCGHDDACRRCGARDAILERHHPLCQHPRLPDFVVRALLEVRAPRAVMKALLRA